MPGGHDVEGDHCYARCRPCVHGERERAGLAKPASDHVGALCRRRRGRCHGPDSCGACLSEVLGQQVIVENVSGAGGMIGASRVAKAPPDGYQFVFGSSGTHAVNQTLYKNPLYNAATKTAPGRAHHPVAAVLVARKDLPASNLPEFVAYGKANQAKMQYGSAGAGLRAPISPVCFSMRRSRSTSPTCLIAASARRMHDLIAGRIDYGCLDHFDRRRADREQRGAGDRNLVQEPLADAAKLRKRARTRPERVRSL